MERGDNRHQGRHADGTAYYMSPEQAEGKRVDHRSDLFSLGVILYELVCHQRPFEGENESAILYEVMTTQPQPLARFCRGAPDELQRIVAKCLTKEPSERYQSAADLVADLRALQRTESFTSHGLPPARRRSRRWAAVSAVVIGIAVIASTIALLTGHLIPSKAPESRNAKCSPSFRSRT